MKLDIRLPIGLLFVVLGILLVVYGLVSDRAIYQDLPVPLNINLWWGIIMLVFGALMTFFGYGGARLPDQPR